MGPVLWGVPAVHTEGLMSLVTRTVTRNILPSSHVILSQVGAPHAHNPTASVILDLDEAGLAEILRQPVAEIQRRRHLPRTDVGYVDFFGCAVRSDEILFRRRRFAPTAVALSAHARALWSLKMIPCCTETWEYLVDTCACGAVQRWQAADRLDRCDQCNAALADTPTTMVDVEHREGISFIIGLIDPDEGRRAAARSQLPSTLATWDGGMVFNLALIVMPLTAAGFTHSRRAEPATADLRQYTASLAQAANIVRRWPEGLIDALADAVRNRSISKHNVRHKGAGHYLAGINSEVLPSIVRSAITDAMASITSMADAVPMDQIGMRQAALLTGQQEHKLAQARRSGHLITRICFRANRVFPTLDRAEMETLKDFLANRLGPERFTHLLGLPQYAMAQLVDENLVASCTHPYIIANYGPLQAHNAELLAFRVALMRAAAPIASIADPIPLHRAARGMGGGAKPWGEIMRDLLSGKIPYSFAGESINCIFISSADAARLQTRNLAAMSASVGSRFVSQRDAAEILNLRLKHAHVLPAIAKRGGGAHRISWTRLRRMARDRITLGELSARSGIHGTRLEWMLERDGCRRHDSLGWIRRKALATIAKY